MKEKHIEEEVEYCECGEELRHFMHNCNGSSEYPEVYGCPVCDDNCGFCE